MTVTMKRLNIWSILMLMTLTFPLMIACGDDDSGNKGNNGGNNGGSTPTTTIDIVGTWRAYYQSNDPTRGQVYDLVTFNADHTGTVIEEVGYGSDGSNTFTWTQTGNVITVMLEGNYVITWTIQQVINNNTVTISDGKRIYNVVRDNTGGGSGGNTSVSDSLNYH